MLAYDRRSRWIRRMQDRVARRREREWAQQAGFTAASFWMAPLRDRDTRRAA